MLQFTPAQFDHFAALLRDSYDRKLAAFFRRETPDLVKHFDDEPLVAVVGYAVDRAESHGVSGSEATLKFVAIWLASGPDFDRRPEVREFLEEPGASPDEKIDELFRSLESHARHRFREASAPQPQNLGAERVRTS
jgi:hypothetical protein